MALSPELPGPGRLKIIAGAVRLYLEREWWRAWQGPEAEGVPASAGMCGRSALTLEQVLVRDFGIDARWASGTPLSADRTSGAGFGFLWNDRWVGHAWVEVGGAWIVDITADQFGAAPLIVAPVSDPTYRTSEETNAADYQAIRAQAAENAWQGWLRSGERAALTQKPDGSARV